ncbi:MAG: cation:proton antiporter [Desulfobacca sp.]|uniref:cation:proton antiporter n=1 Tax=Desulfobacca sp. TaxID=2067990 RepID=UPI00404B7629
MEQMWFTAASWLGLALVASLISIRTGISVALVEIFLGVVGGNFLGFQPNEWINVLAAFGSMMLTFLAGAEIDPDSLRKHLTPSLVIGGVSFLFPFLGAMAFTYYVNGWALPEAQIAGIALSTTSVAVVYAVMVETRLNETDLGKLILAACFVTDLGTVLALGVLFARYDRWLIVFVVVTALALWLLPRCSRSLFTKYGGRVSEPEVKFIFLVLCFLGALAVTASSEAVLPAYLFGLVVAGVFVRDKVLLHRMRTITFTLLTPFFFIKAGALISIPALISGFWLIIILLAVKLATKIIGVWPLTKYYGMTTREGNYVTLLMATGLTFGSISALYGLTNNIINQAQYSVLVTVVIASAVVPTFIATTWFSPKRPFVVEPVVYGTMEHFLHYPEEV